MIVDLAAAIEADLAERGFPGRTRIALNAIRGWVVQREDFTVSSRDAQVEVVARARICGRVYREGFWPDPQYPICDDGETTAQVGP